jgi:hypothetical protein
MGELSLMARDSLFNEEVLWSGRPKVLTVPPAFKLAAWVSAIVSASTLCFALVAATALGVHPGGMIAFAAWCATLALGAWRLPLVWRSGVEYLVTEKHVIWRRGKFRRSIERGAISYARIRWSARDARVGDLVLVRAVPTGALRRTLNLALSDVEAPDRLWAIVRGVVPSATLGNGERSLAQRLDDGERVVWSAIPLSSPWKARRVATAASAAVLAFATVRIVARDIPPLRRVWHALPPATLAVLALGMALAVLLVAAVAAFVAYAAWVHPVRLAKATRYFVTNRRVLIRRGNEELHLDRSRIAYVIAAPSRAPGAKRRKLQEQNDLFLVLDGPQARALAPMGAFGGDEGGKLVPVFNAIDDAETVGAILKEAA